MIMTVLMIIGEEAIEGEGRKGIGRMGGEGRGGRKRKRVNGRRV